MIGQAYERSGRTDLAAMAFERAIAIDEDRPDAHEGLARCHLQCHRWEAAAEEALFAVALDHNRSEPHLTLGLALVRMGRRDRAADALQNALLLRPGWPAALEAIAKLRVSTRQGATAPSP
jgi:tetratricopeptide (TPR) repeat protein